MLGLLTLEAPAVEVYHDWTLVQWLLVGGLWLISVGVILLIGPISEDLADRFTSRIGGVVAIAAVIALAIIGIAGTILGPHLYFRHIEVHGIAIALGLIAFIGYGVVTFIGWQQGRLTLVAGGGLGMAAVIVTGIIDTLERAAGSVPMTVGGLIVIGGLIAAYMFLRPSAQR
jgi:hypothetical protein